MITVREGHAHKTGRVGEGRGTRGTDKRSRRRHRWRLVVRTRAAQGRGQRELLIRILQPAGWGAAVRSGVTTSTQTNDWMGSVTMSCCLKIHILNKVPLPTVRLMELESRLLKSFYSQDASWFLATSLFTCEGSDHEVGKSIGSNIQYTFSPRLLVYLPWIVPLV